MEKIKKMFGSVSSRKGSYSIGLVGIVLAIAVVINMIAGQLPENLKKIDISNNDLYDISEVTTGLLDGLDHKIEMKVIAELDTVDTRIETFVKKYAGLSKNIDVEWIDSIQHPSVLQEYDTSGNVIIVSCQDTGKSTVVNFSDIIQTSYSYYYSGSESAFDGEGQLTSAINYVTSNENGKIYRTTGHGENTFSTATTELLTKNNLEVSELNLSMDTEIPKDCDLLFLYAPTSDITEDEKTILMKYLSNGGKVYLVLGNTAEETPNLDEMMAYYGMERVNGYIADTQRCYQGNYYAIFPELSLIGELGKGIRNEMVMLYNSMGLQMTELDSDTIITYPFMQTSSNGYAVTEEGQTQGQYVLGAYATESIKVDDEEAEDGTVTLESRFTVIASDSMIDSSITDQLTTLENLTLFVNSVMENFDDVENLAIEPKSLTVEYNTPLHAGPISLLVIFVLPAAILIFGVVKWMKRRKA